MARFDVTGMEAVIREMARMDQQTGRVADEMLMAAAGVMTEAWRYAIASHGHVDTGAMFDSVRPSKPTTRGGVKSLTVYPQGRDENGVRNAEKAFIANFGRIHQRGTRFVEEAEDTGEEPALTAMVAVWDQFIGDT